MSSLRPEHLPSQFYKQEYQLETKPRNEHPTLPKDEIWLEFTNTLRRARGDKYYMDHEQNRNRCTERYRTEPPNKKAGLFREVAYPVYLIPQKYVKPKNIYKTGEDKQIEDVITKGKSPTKDEPKAQSSPKEIEPEKSKKQLKKIGRETTVTKQQAKILK